MARQSLASIGKKARHQKDTTTSKLNKDNTNKRTTSKDHSNMVPSGNEDCSNMVPNSNVMHTNVRRSNWKKQGIKKILHQH